MAAALMEVLHDLTVLCTLPGGRLQPGSGECKGLGGWRTSVLCVLKVASKGLLKVILHVYI